MTMPNLSCLPCDSPASDSVVPIRIFPFVAFKRVPSPCPIGPVASRSFTERIGKAGQTTLMPFMITA